MINEPFYINIPDNSLDICTVKSYEIMTFNKRLVILIICLTIIAIAYFIILIRRNNLRKIKND